MESKSVEERKKTERKHSPSSSKRHHHRRRSEERHHHHHRRRSPTVTNRKQETKPEQQQQPQPHGIDGKPDNSTKNSRKRSRSRGRYNNRRGRERSPSQPKPCATEEEARMRDAHCVFVSQLQVKATESDIHLFFSAVCKVVEVALIKEKNTGQSKGFGYVELATMEDVSKALLLSGLPFRWRDGTKGFPITVRPSEAHKMFLEKGSNPALWVTAPTHHSSSNSKAVVPVVELIEMVGPGSAKARVDGGPIQILPTHRGKPMNTKILYVGNLDKSLTEKDLADVFATFGAVDSVQLKVDPNTGISKGFAFVRFVETLSAANANDKLDGYELMGLKLTCNPVNDKTMSGEGGGKSNNKDDSWTSLDDEEYVANLGANRRVQLMSKLAGGAAQEWASSATNPLEALEHQLSSKQGLIHGGMDAPNEPTRRIAILNMFDPTTETGQDWEIEIEKDTKEECERFGPVQACVVDKISTTGRVFVTFQNVQDAKKCADSLRGRWFNQRQIAVEYIAV